MSFRHLRITPKLEDSSFAVKHFFYLEFDFIW